MVSIEVHFDSYVLFGLKFNVFQDKVRRKWLKGSVVVVSEVLNGETGKLLHRKIVFCQFIYYAVLRS